MRVKRLRAALAASLMAVVVLLGIAPGAFAADDVVLTTPFAGDEVLYDSSNYTTEPGEILACPPGTSGGRTGWTRYVAPLSGVVTVTLTTDYDAILHVYTAPASSPPGLAGLQDMGCADADHAEKGGIETRPVGIATGQSVYVQTLGVCEAPCNAMGAETGAGANTLKFSLVPDDTDQDGVADTADACPEIAGTEADGCPLPPPPDADKDGVPDARDACAGAAGDLANGCPSQINGTIRGRWRVNRLMTQLVSLVVEAPLGSRINMRCEARKGVCPFSRRVVNTTTRRTTNLTSYFGRRKVFPSNMNIFIRVTHDRQIGIYQRLVTRRGRKLPKVTRACIYTDGKARPCT